MKIIFFIIGSILFTVNIFGQIILFEDNFNNGSFKSEWELNPNLEGVSGTIFIENGIGQDDGHAVRIGKSADGSEFTTNGLDLRLDLRGQREVEMNFWITDQDDDDHPKDGLYFSDDSGESFKKVLDFYPTDWCEGVWGIYPSIDVDELASMAGLILNSQFVIRIQQTGISDFSGASSNRDGFLLENVKVYNPALEYTELPVDDDFDNAILPRHYAWNFADATSTINSEDAITNPMSLVGVFDEIGWESTPGILMGKRCDGNYVTNALDLHLDLSNNTDVELTFNIKDNFDEADLDDGIYFSNNAGLSFEKVLDFNPDEWCDDVWGKHPHIDVDKLATAAGLILSNQFVIRFQHRGRHDYSGAASNSDGIYIDNVKVYETGLLYKALPIEDDFDDGLLPKHWAWNFADATTFINSDDAITNPMSLVGVYNEVGLEDTPGILMGKLCDGTYVTNAMDLHLNLANSSDVKMTFWIKDSFDDLDEEDGIYLSDNGGLSFEKIVDFHPDEWCDDVWGQHPPLNISKLAASVGLEPTSTSVIRFQHRGRHDYFGASSNVDGFYIDNVEIYESKVEYATIPFNDDFEDGSFGNYWDWNTADASTFDEHEDAISSPMGLVDVHNGTGYDQSAFSVRMGRRCDGNYSNNALDLHLNLEGEERVKMTFWLSDSYDETHIDDGIFFSNDGGNTFKKVYDFDWSQTPNNEFELYQIDISALASAADLPITDQFTVRFQQRGKDNFNGASSNIDGIYLDDVNVVALLTSSKEILSSTKATIYPNPSSSNIYIELENKSIAIENYRLMDINGQVLISQTQEINSTQLDISDFPEGIYMLSLKLTDGKYIYRKLSKK